MKAAVPIAIVIVAAAIASCVSYRMMRIESSPAAEVRDWGGNLICATTPCVMRVSRETCGLYDSSKGYIILTARSSAGISMRSMAIKTCDITDDARVMFLFPGDKCDAGCSVRYYKGDREVYRTRCTESLVNNGAGG